MTRLRQPTCGLLSVEQVPALGAHPGSRPRSRSWTGPETVGGGFSLAVLVLVILFSFVLLF